MEPMERAVKDFIQILEQKDFSCQGFLREARALLRHHRLDPASAGPDFAHSITTKEDMVAGLSPQKRRMLLTVVEQLR